jgi:pimeloyl-ACP methyl ester carboxylesterase
MKTTMRNTAWAGLAMAATAWSPALSAQGLEVETTTPDGVVLFGDLHAGDLGPEAPMIVLFHQAGSSARGEYRPIVPWLNGLGYRLVTWDLRAGGDRHGSPNRTVQALGTGGSDDYCGSYVDLVAALDATLELDGVDSAVVWGSSYSAALAFRLAADRPDDVGAVVAFSPAAGGPMESCRPRDWLDALRAPALAFRPASEMELESSQEQRTILEAAGVDFEVVPDGVHGSSMLVDERTGHDMSATRERLAEWLRRR